MHKHPIDRHLVKAREASRGTLSPYEVADLWYDALRDSILDEEIDGDVRLLALAILNVERGIFGLDSGFSVGDAVSMLPKRG